MTERRGEGSSSTDREERKEGCSERKGGVLDVEAEGKEGAVKERRGAFLTMERGGGATKG